MNARTCLSVFFVMALLGGLFAGASTAQEAGPDVVPTGGGGPTRGGDVLFSMPRANQLDSSVAYNTHREFLVVWTDDRDRTVSGLNIYGQLFSEVGVPFGEPFFVTNAAGDQQRPDVAYNHGFDDYMVVWEDCRKGPEDCDIYGQRVSADGDGRHHGHAGQRSAHGQPAVADDPG